MSPARGASRPTAALTSTTATTSRTVAQQVVDTTSGLLQAKPAAGSAKVLQITPLVELTKASVTSQSCWTLADYVGNSLK